MLTIEFATDYEILSVGKNKPKTNIKKPILPPKPPRKKKPKRITRRIRSSRYS